jgi:hypothetical protein
METTADKIAKAQNHFGTDANLANSLSQHMQSKNYSAYSNQFVTAAKTHGIELTADEVSTHFGFKNDPSWKDQVKDTVKDEAKGAAKDEATGRVEDELSNQLGVDVSGVGGAAEEVSGFFKKLFGKKK